MIKYIRVKFNDFERTDKKYSFITTFNDLEHNDYLVVMTQYGPKTAQFVDYIKSTSKATKWVVSKINLEEHNKRIIKMEEINKIQYKLENRKAELEEKAIWQLLAKEDSEIASMLIDLETLTKELI